MVLLYSFRISICKVFHPKMPFLTPNNTNIYRNVLSRVIVLYSGGNIKAAHYTHNTFVSCYCLDMDNHTLNKNFRFCVAGTMYVLFSTPHALLLWVFKYTVHITNPFPQI